MGKNPKNLNCNPNPRIRIVFHNKEKPFFEYLKGTLGMGHIYKENENTSRYTIAKLQDVSFIINMINGKFRTPKVYCLYKAIDLINSKYNLSIKKLPLDKGCIQSNPWLAGFVDGCFFIYLTGKYAINKNLKGKTRVRCSFKIKQRIIDGISGMSCMPFMLNIANCFNVKIHGIIKNEMSVAVQATSKQYLVQSYFEKYPLMTSKYLNYLDYIRGLNYLGRSLNKDEILEIQAIKNSMNNKRTYFN